METENDIANSSDAETKDDTIYVSEDESVEDTFARVHSLGHNKTIDIENAKWNKAHEKEMKMNLHRNDKLVESLREMGICYNPEYYKKATGQNVYGNGNAANESLRKRNFELADVKTDFYDEDI